MSGEDHQEGQGSGDRVPGHPHEPGTNSKGAHAPKSDDAFIMPDDPIPPRPRREERPRAEVREAIVAAGDASMEEMTSMSEDDAFISPDEPIPHRDPVDKGTTFDPESVDPGDVMVTGMGDDAHLDPEELAAGGDPHVLELTARVRKLAEALRQRGEAGLRTGPGMDRFDATLRAYCVGYLAGRRASEE